MLFPKDVAGNSEQVCGEVDADSLRFPHLVVAMKIPDAKGSLESTCMKRRRSWAM